MRLLVSVRSADEAELAVRDGADIVDAKEPLNGALGQVDPATLHSIATALAGAAPLSVALGDAGSDDIDSDMRAAIDSGAAFMKVGFAGHPGLKLAMVEDLVMEFEEAPPGVEAGLARLRSVQRALEDALVPIMAGVVKRMRWMD